MASDENHDGEISFAVSAQVGDWIDDQAGREDVNRGDVCRRIIATAHSLATDESIGEPVDREALVDLRAEVHAQREEFGDLLEDVRGRVIQVKREADSKAGADHAHPETVSNDDLSDLEAGFDRLENDLDRLEETVAEGFENYETVLEHLVEETERLEARSSGLSAAVLELAEKRETRFERDRERAAAEALALAANRLGVRSANCDGCSNSVDVALLSKPECPHCGRSLADVEQRTSFLRSHVLVTGEPPMGPNRTEGGADADELFEAIAGEGDLDD